MKDEQYCMVHNKKFKERVNAQALLASEEHAKESKERRKIKVNSFDDLMNVQKRVFESLARRSGDMTAKQLASFVALGNALSRGFKEQAYARIKSLESKLEHL